MTPAQSRAARALLDWTQPKLAKSASLGISTVVDFERARRSVSAEAIAAIRAWGRERAVPASGQPMTQDKGHPQATRRVLV